MMIHRSFTLPLCTALLMSLAGAHADAAQTVYRCGNTYNYVGCPNARAVAATSPVSASDRKEAERVVARQRRLGLDMEGDRRREAASIKPARAGSFRAAPVRASASAPRKNAKRAKASHRDTAVADSDQTPVFAARVPPEPRTK